MIILVKKPSGMTSHDVVAKIKYAVKKSGENIKIGHTGTLDPMCTGVLTVLTDKYTKLSDLMPSGKSYRAGLLLGRTTSTEDITGEILELKEVTVSENDVKNATEKFKGEIYQIPPMYSAVKKDGRKLYEFARQGIEIEREKRKIHIYNIDCKKSEKSNEYILDVDCSGGTYIRTLCSDIGNFLGCGGCMSFLERTKANGFSLSECHDFETILQHAEHGTLADISLSCEKAFKNYQKAYIDESAVKYYLNGGSINDARITYENTIKEFEKDSIFLVYSKDHSFMGLGRVDEKGSLKSIWSEKNNP